MAEFHGEGASALGCRAKVCRVAEHARKGAGAGNKVVGWTRLHGLDNASTAGDGRNDFANILAGSRDLNAHDRLLQHRFCFGTHGIEGQGSTALCGNGGSGKFVVANLVDRHGNVRTLVAILDAAFQRALDSFSYALDDVLGDGRSICLDDKAVFSLCFQRRDG